MTADKTVNVDEMNKENNEGTEKCKLDFKRYNKVVQLTTIILSQSMKIQYKLIHNCFCSISANHELRSNSPRLHPRSYGDDVNLIQAVIAATDRYVVYKNKGFVRKMQQ
jgi:hypothetical protein